ncbi:hypothetical protein PHMEG_00035014 [Phytophthora megakarya]|uniref:Uncharacterized protein n=1 Tax=Phytophthora megakarya TaxID=4795 RepID=A0A225UPZ3_9STRA|nr:hypothetical protein PHMEG_00035014 [Phytophthora megakarya]
MSSEGDGCFSGLYADETGWMCVQPLAAGVSMEICVQQTPMRFETNRHAAAMAKFYDLLRDSLEAEKLEMTRCMERLLIDDIVAGISAEYRSSPLPQRNRWILERPKHFEVYVLIELLDSTFQLIKNYQRQYYLFHCS